MKERVETRHAYTGGGRFHVLEKSGKAPDDFAIVERFRDVIKFVKRNAGFFRNSTLKRKHKGRVWGMYVADSARGQGIGKALLAALIERAKQLPDLDAILLSVASSQVAASAA